MKFTKIQLFKTNTKGIEDSIGLIKYLLRLFLESGGGMGERCGGGEFKYDIFDTL
jgi:hypothetical protein